MSIIIPTLVSWLFAVWWLVTGFLDFNVIRFDAAGSTRYRKTLPLLLSIFASSALRRSRICICIKSTLTYIAFTLVSSRRFESYGVWLRNEVGKKSSPQNSPVGKMSNQVCFGCCSPPYW